MRIAELGWTQVEEYLARDDRAVLPIGSTEQHAYLSLATDSILAERVAVDAAEPLGVPVFPVLAYGVTPGFLAYPGTVTLRVETHHAVLGDVLDSLRATGFRRVLIVNGHGGNAAAKEFAARWAEAHSEMRVRFHSWWNAPRTIARVGSIDPVASHASWMENFPWTRLAALASPDHAKPMVDLARVRRLGPRELRSTWETATSAAAMCATMTRCVRSGPKRWRKRAHCSRTRGSDRAPARPLRVACGGRKLR